MQIETSALKGRNVIKGYFFLLTMYMCVDDNWHGMKYTDPSNSSKESKARSLQILIFKSNFSVF